jgi:hypothetical protein
MRIHECGRFYSPEGKDLSTRWRASRPGPIKGDASDDWDDLRVARVKRSIKRTARMVSDAEHELETHQRWLGKHREVWSKEVASLERHIKAKSFARSAISLLTLPAAAFVRFFDWLSRQQLQLQIGSICQPKAAKKPTASRTLSEASAVHGSTRMLPRLMVWIALLIALLLIAERGSRAMITPAPKVSKEILVDPVRSVTVPKTRSKPEPIRGFSLAAVSVLERISMPPRTVADIMSITTPFALAPTETHTVTAPIKQATPAAKPKAKVRVKRRTASEQTQQRPWWQTLPWIRVQ